MKHLVIILRCVKNIFIVHFFVCIIIGILIGIINTYKHIENNNDTLRIFSYKIKIYMYKYFCGIFSGICVSIIIGYGIPTMYLYILYIYLYKIIFLINNK